MPKPADDASGDGAKGSFIDLFPDAKGWAAFTAAVAGLVALAAYAYEWGYGSALDFNVIGATTVTDRASEWPVIWPLLLAIFCGRLLIPLQRDVSKYPEWVKQYRSNPLSEAIWIPFGVLCLVFLIEMFIPAIRQLYTDEDPSGTAAYLFVLIALIVVSSPIIQVTLGFLGPIGYFALVAGVTVLGAHFLGSYDGENALHQNGPVTLACLKEAGKTPTLPFEILRSFDSGYLIRSSGYLRWLDRKDAKNMEISGPVNPGYTIACTR